MFEPPLSHNEPMGSRCSTCSIVYPLEYKTCLACEGPLWKTYNSGPDDDWSDQVRARVRELAGEAPMPPSPYPHPPEARVPVEWHGDRLWIAHTDLLNSGYRSLEDDDIVFVNGSFYELQAYARSRRQWWVEEIITENAADGLYAGQFDVVEGSDE